MASALIISGAGEYGDPWHPFAQTSDRLAGVIGDLGHRVEVSQEVERSLLSLVDQQLLVINVGNPDPPRPGSTMIEIQDSLLTFVARGGGLLGMHVSATSFTTMPRWPEILGGHWMRGASMHPALAPARIQLHPGVHPVAGDQREIEVEDERYSYLDVKGDVTVIGDHVHNEVVHPMIWARSHGPGRVVYDGLGHDTRSYDSLDHLALLQRAVRWLLGG